LSEGQHVQSSSRKTPLIIIGGVAVVAAVVGLVFVLSGGSEGPLGAAVGADQPEVPEFSFKVSEPSVITTAPNPNPEAPGLTPAQTKIAEKKAVTAALPAAAAASKALDTFYTAAFLDPANWQDAVYDEAFTDFSQQAQKQAADQVEVLTAGSDAGTTFDSIVPLTSTVRTRVLLDPKGLPASVVGIVKFQASGFGTQGRHQFVSTGQYVFQRVDGRWTVVSFSVSRDDKDKAANTASGSGSPSAATASGSTP
jgi:hypothetical protein